MQNGEGHLMQFIRRPSWTIAESAVTDESLYLNRRAILAGLGAGMGLAAIGAGQGQAAVAETPMSALANPAYADAGRAVTPEALTASYNNYYEFGSSKRIAAESQALPTEPWALTIDGLVETPVTIDIDDLVAALPPEERIYRHRCVEAWSMVVPWMGIPLRKVLALAAPLSSAKFVQFESFMMPDIATEQRASWYPWPYMEGLSIAEANHDLPLLVVGAYGKVLHKQFGAPIRLHAPWKYGFKSSKGLVKITLTDTQPLSFWENLNANEYGFWANVNPEVPHPRWTQATERPIDADERIPTQLFNGYAAELEGVYGDLPNSVGERFWR